MKNNIVIRSATVNDAKELLKIYAPYVQNTAITFEYEIPTLENFSSRILDTLKRYPFLIAESDNEILGYAYAGIFKDRAAYSHSVETSIYVKIDKRQIGVGKKLYTALEEELKARGILNLNACIAYAEKPDEFLNNDSVLFHQKMGYTFVGRFHKCGCKFNRWYDMIWMEKLIGEHI